MLTCFKLVAFAVADYPELRGAAIDRAIICAGVWMNRTLPRAHPEEFNMSGCFAPGDGMSHTICLLCLCAANGTLRCAPHGKQETESGKNAERARNSQQIEREGATRVDPHAAVFVQAAPTCDRGYCWDQQWLVARYDKVTINPTC
jgi:hypothetical protein